MLVSNIMLGGQGLATNHITPGMKATEQRQPCKNLYMFNTTRIHIPCSKYISP